MKKLSILALLGFTPVFAATTTCTGIMSTPIQGDLVVPAGATCELHWVDVAGNTTVEGRLISFTSHFHGNVSVTRAGIIQILNGWSGNSPIEGNLNIHDTLANADPNVYNGIWCPDGPTLTNIVNGNIILTNNAGAFYVCSASVGGNVVANNNTGRLALGSLSAIGTIVINGNTGGVELDNTSAGGNLVCQGNSPAPATTVHGSNSAVGQTVGQCAGL